MAKGNVTKIKLVVASDGPGAKRALEEVQASVAKTEKQTQSWTR